MSNAELSAVDAMWQSMKQDNDNNINMDLGKTLTLLAAPNHNKTASRSNIVARASLQRSRARDNNKLKQQKKSDLALPGKSLEDMILSLQTSPSPPTTAYPTDISRVATRSTSSNRFDCPLNEHRAEALLSNSPMSYVKDPKDKNEMAPLLDDEGNSFVWSDSCSSAHLDSRGEDVSYAHAAFIGDSDDDSDCDEGDEENNDPHRAAIIDNANVNADENSNSTATAIHNSRSWTIARFVSVLKDKDHALPVQRLEALCALRWKLQQLCQSLSLLMSNSKSNKNNGEVDTDLVRPPPLNFEKPFHVSTIALTHQHSSGGQVQVSDLPSAEHAPQWAPWQRTHASVMDQFQSSSNPLLNTAVAVTEDETNTHHHDTNSSCQHQHTHTNCERERERELVHVELQRLANGCAAMTAKSLNDTTTTTAGGTSNNEQCRAVALHCLSTMCLFTRDLTHILPFVMTGLLHRFSLGNYFDSELNLFYTDVSDHAFFKRGGASQRQDQSAIAARERSVRLVEESEDNRQLQCQCLNDLLRGCLARGTANILTPYFHDILLALQSMLSDPCSLVKLDVMSLLVQVCRAPLWEESLVPYATALARSTLPLLRHRHSKVRCQALDLFEASVSIPNRLKIKGAGTEAIMDLVGFREENVSYIRLLKCGTVLQ
jgi:hypothetical protein